MNNKQYQEIGQNLVDSMPNWSDIEDDLSLCSYVSKTQGIELTLKEAQQVRDVYDILTEDET